MDTVSRVPRVWLTRVWEKSLPSLYRGASGRFQVGGGKCSCKVNPYRCLTVGAGLLPYWVRAENQTREGQALCVCGSWLKSWCGTGIVEPLSLSMASLKMQRKKIEAHSWLHDF